MQRDSGGRLHRRSLHIQRAVALSTRARERFRTNTRGSVVAATYRSADGVVLKCLRCDVEHWANGQGNNNGRGTDPSAENDADAEHANFETGAHGATVEPTYLARSGKQFEGTARRPRVNNKRNAAADDGDGSANKTPPADKRRRIIDQASYGIDGGSVSEDIRDAPPTWAAPKKCSDDEKHRRYGPYGLPKAETKARLESRHEDVIGRQAEVRLIEQRHACADEE